MSRGPDRLERTLAALDVGLQESIESGGANVGRGCFRCGREAPVNAIDLCRDCEAWLHAGLTVPAPAGATLLAHGTLPEEIDSGERPFGEGDEDWHELAPGVFRRGESWFLRDQDRVLISFTSPV